jgi:hypothetical protein
MSATFVLRCWDPAHGRYIERGKYGTLERAEIMFNKPYFRTHTRRLIKISVDVLYTERAEKTRKKR